MSSEAKNLAAISHAIDDHNGRCSGRAVAVRMNPFEVERLGWDEIRGLPIEGDPKLATGMFHIVCEDEGIEGASAVSTIEAVGREPVAA